MVGASAALAFATRRWSCWLNRDERHAMKLTLRSTWAAVILGAVVGCAGEEETTAPSNPASPGAAATATKNYPKEPSKEGASKEMLPPPKDESKPAPAGKTDENPKLEPPKTEEAPKGAAARTALSSDELAAIKELPAAEQDQAIKQAVCPVSNEHLGEMGKPFKVVAEGRTIFLCCEGCEAKVKSDPKAYIAKLDAQAAKK